MSPARGCECIAAKTAMVGGSCVDAGAISDTASMRHP
jgi:hypothetical protein